MIFRSHGSGRGPATMLLLLLSLGVGPASARVVPPETTPQSTAKSIEEAALKVGPWKVATLREQDGIRNGPAYRGGTIHHPVDAKGPLAIMVICPGFNASEGSVRPWGRYLASHGIVAMTLGTNERRDFPIVRGRALLDAIETVRAENVREGSPLKGLLAVDRAGVAGWSMGGGGAQHAAVLDASLKAVVALVPWQPGYRFQHPVPVMILAGDEDKVASTRANSRPHFDNTPDTTPKLLFEIRGGGHFLPSSPANHDGQVGAWALAWIKVFVEGDESYRAMLDRKPSKASIYELSIPGSEEDPALDHPPD